MKKLLLTVAIVAFCAMAYTNIEYMIRSLPVSREFTLGEIIQLLEIIIAALAIYYFVTGDILRGKLALGMIPVAVGFDIFLLLQWHLPIYSWGEAVSTYSSTGNSMIRLANRYWAISICTAISVALVVSVASILKENSFKQ